MDHEGKMAVRISRVYTRKGDKGETGLVGGGRVLKNSQRIEAFGTVDELNALVGLARAFNREMAQPIQDRVEEILKAIQNELFNLGSELATPARVWRKDMPSVGPREVQNMEKDRKSTRLNSSHIQKSRMPSSA